MSDKPKDKASDPAVDPAKVGHDPDEVKPESKKAADATGAMLPTFPPQPAGEPENTHGTSPAGPGKPEDGSPAVNTYTPRAKQSAEFNAGDQDWQSLVATKAPDIELPSAQASAKPNPRTKATPDGKPADLKD